MILSNPQVPLVLFGRSCPERSLVGDHVFVYSFLREGHCAVPIMVSKVAFRLFMAAITPWV